jgi:1,4-dihydroxy-2-naphthoate octaprenyltransferase
MDALLKITKLPVLPVVAAGLLIGGFYPLTQVYQHDQDSKDGVTTISMLLGLQRHLPVYGNSLLRSYGIVVYTFRENRSCNELSGPGIHYVTCTRIFL